MREANQSGEKLTWTLTGESSSRTRFHTSAPANGI